MRSAEAGDTDGTTALRIFHRSVALTLWSAQLLTGDSVCKKPTKKPPTYLTSAVLLTSTAMCSRYILAST